MAIVIRRPRRPKLGPLPLDCTVSEDHGLENEITDSPVERGADVTDHIRNLPQTLTLEGIVTPHHDSSIVVDLIRQGFRAFDSTAHLEAWQTLREVWRRREPIEVTTSLRKYRSMVVESLSTTRDVDTSGILRFSATLRELRFASVDLAVNVDPSTAGLAGADENLGTQGMSDFESL